MKRRKKRRSEFCIPIPYATRARKYKRHSPARNAGKFTKDDRGACLWPRLAGTAHDVLVARQLLDPYWPASMEFIGRNADFRAHAKLAAVRKLSRRVVEDDCTVDA